MKIHCLLASLWKKTEILVNRIDQSDKDSMLPTPGYSYRNVGGFVVRELGEGWGGKDFDLMYG
jgi:hypothetical protein